MTFELPPNWTADRVREWLLTLTSGGLSDLPMPSDISVPVAVNTMFRQTPAERRERLKTGVVLALQEWQYAAHRYQALEQLSKIAALVRATQAIPRIATHIRLECALKRADPERRSALAATTACLTGFAPAAELDMWLSIVFNDPDVDPALAGLLFVGLCKGEPRTMATHVSRFLELRESVQGGARRRNFHGRTGARIRPPRYCGRALLSAEQHGREDRKEALFLRVLCTRVLASDPKQYQHALSLLDDIGSTGQPDARHLAEHGNIRVRWFERAAAESHWRPAPPLAEATEWLERAAAACGPDRRLLASVQNSLSYAWIHAYQDDPTPDIKQRASDALRSLTDTLYTLEKDSDHWPLRIKDTLVRGSLVVGGPPYDAAMIRRIIEGIKGDLESDVFAGDRDELRRHLHEYEAELRKRAW